MSVVAKVDEEKFPAYRMKDVYGYATTLVHSYTFNGKYFLYFGSAEIRLPSTMISSWVLISNNMKDMLIVAGEEFCGDVVFTQRLFRNYDEMEVVEWFDGAFIEEKRFYCITDMNFCAPNERVFVERYGEYCAVRGLQRERLATMLGKKLFGNNNVLRGKRIMVIADKILKRRGGLKKTDKILCVVHLHGGGKNCFVAKVRRELKITVNMFLAGKPLV